MLANSVLNSRYCDGDETMLYKTFVNCVIPPYFNNSSPGVHFSRAFSSTLFVKGILFSSTEDRLAEAFSKYGEVLEAKVIMNKAGDRSKGYGYVTFARENEAQKALMEMNGKLLHGRVIYVDYATRPRRHGSEASGTHLETKPFLDN